MKQCGYSIYFWSNENDEPIHVHVSKGKPTENSTKIWITKSGGCIIANNKSNIPTKELKEIKKLLSDNYFLIVSKWRKYFKNKNLKFYC